ncbi:golgin subfamily A member 1 isoform X1 [Aricia agestis]|uniref:golgin subfamily A member 1 isoform X1 n=1 Tax=Aricia agestis TaxID=91739 RepID=UPI001C2023DF|nr:golgin subfamily A member 1 isoform X1 [Aricia agestis]
MFASLKSKIKEETGSDISKLTSSWRSGALLSRLTLRDDSSTTTPTSSAGQVDSTSDSISPQLQTYLSDRTGGEIDQVALHQQYTEQLEAKLRDRDLYWEQKIEELRNNFTAAQGEEAIAAQSVARIAQAEAAKAITERDATERQLNELKIRLAAAESAQLKLDALNEEVEELRRSWTQERGALRAAAGAAEALASDAQQQLELLRAALPTDHPEHHMHDDDKISPTGCESFDRVCRERAVLSRQLTEARMALADVKTSWSGQIASLETQVARVSRQAGEEGAERRRMEAERRELLDKIASLTTELDKAKQNLANSEAKVARLSGEVRALAQEVRGLRAGAAHSDEVAMGLEARIEALSEENKELREALDSERRLVAILREKVDKSGEMYDEQTARVNHLNTTMADMQHDFIDMQRKFDKEKREKDEALLRNAHMSQSMEMSQCNVRYLETEVVDLKSKVAELEAVIAQHKEVQAECMVIKENDKLKEDKIVELQRRIQEREASETDLKKTIQDLQVEICDKNKKIKTLDNRISDMKKTLQRELQSSKSDLTTAEEQDISRRYLKHVVLRFLTARELEARQLTRALATLLRLSAHEEALLRAALPARAGLASWFPSLGA